MSVREPGRPSPEELLERYDLKSPDERQRRGRLRVFLGAAPGVGKTYAMLNEGRRLQADGYYIVAATVGFINTDPALSATRYYQQAQVPVIVSCTAGIGIAQQFDGPDYRRNYVFRFSMDDGAEVGELK